MRSPRSVTMQPMGMPLRILKFAMDFFARVITGFCPAIWPSSCAAVSSSFTFWLASPRPIFTVTFETRGTAIVFEYPKRLVSAGTASLRYFSCKRRDHFISSLYLLLCPLVSQMSCCSAGRPAFWCRPAAWCVRRACASRIPGKPASRSTRESGLPCREFRPRTFFDGFGRVCFLMMLACSTVTAALRRVTVSTLPVLPFDRPGHHLHHVAMANPRAALLTSYAAFLIATTLPGRAR